MRRFLITLAAVAAAFQLQAQDPNPPNYQKSCHPFLPYQVNLLAYYSFTGGSTVNQGFVGGPLNGAPMGGAIPTIDAGGNPNCAFEFNGTPGCFIQVAPHPSLNINTTGGGATISVWYKPRETASGKYELLIGRGNTFHCPDGFGDYSLGLYDCRKPVGQMNSHAVWELSLQQNGFSCIEQTNAYLNDDWQHMLVIFRNVGGVLIPVSTYWNGINVNNTPTLCPPVWVSQFGNLYIGKDFKGKMDDIRIYNISFTPSDVAALYNYGIMGCCQGDPEPEPCNIEDISWCSSLTNPFTYTFDVFTNPGGAAVVWDFGDGTGPFPSTGGTTMTHMYPGPGTYMVCVDQLEVNEQVCDTKCMEICIGNNHPPRPSGTTQSTDKTDIIGEPYPNPTNDVLFIPLQTGNMQDEEISIRILSIEGAVVFEDKKQVKAGEQKISVSLKNIAPGNYILEVAGSKNNATKLFTKQ